MIRTYYSIILLFCFSIANGQTNSNCNSIFPVDSIAFDMTFFTQVNDTIYGINQQENSWSTSFGDYDNDGFMDLFVANYDSLISNQLYHNNGDGTFTKVISGNPIVTDVAESTAGVWGDYDNDGDIDLFVSNSFGYDNFLYRNEGSGVFTKILNDPIVNYVGFSHGASWIDYDNDGLLDMFVPEFLHIGVNKLYKNDGNGAFTSVTNTGLTSDAAYSVSSVWGDYDNDGDQDVFIPNTNDHDNFLYQNNGDGTFSRITTGDIVNDGGESTGASWGDYDNDCDLDLFVANASFQANFLYENNGDGTFTKITNSVVSTTAGHSHGSAWADFDNDGDLDLIVTNDSNSQNEFYVNNGDGTFTAIDNAVTNLFGESFGAAVADIDNDNDLDLHVANHDADVNELYINEYGTCNNSMAFSLEGTISNRSAYGTRVKILAIINGIPTWQMRELTALTGGGISGQNDSRLFFGLGDATVIDSLEITWTSGINEVFTNIPVNNSLQVFVEPNTSKVCGVVYDDLNRNCQRDGNELGIINIPIVIQPGNFITYTNQNGEYYFDLEIGNYTITAIDTFGWEQNCMPTIHNVDITTVGDQYCGFDFADTAICQEPNLYVELIGASLHAGVNSQYIIDYGNNGLEGANDVTLKIDFGQYITPLWSSLPWDSQSGTTYTWNIGTVASGQHSSFHIEDSVSLSAVVGTSASVTATILDNILMDCNSFDNIDNDVNTVTLIGPNIINVTPVGLIDNQEELTYTVEFQNFRNTLYDGITIENELPAVVDMFTLEIQESSHPNEFRIEGRKLIWEFSNDDLLNTEMYGDDSHGFVTYKITPNQDLEVGTEIKGQALINFVNYKSIYTNTVINVIDKSAEIESGNIGVCPNPTVSYTIVFLDAVGEELQSVEVYTVHGIRFITFNNLSGDRIRIDEGTLPEGHYFIRAKSNTGNIYTTKLLVEEQY